jgi:hypothetical protein
MTLDEIRTHLKPMLTPAQAAPVLGCSPNTLRWQAQTDPERLGFPVAIVGSRVRIPRVPFIHFIEGKEGGYHDADAV